jgi:hypothetical protein
MLYIDGLAWQAFAAGQLEQAVEHWASISTDPANAGPAGALLARMSIWLNDADAVERWIGVFWNNVIHGGAPEADHFAFEAGLHGLRGDRNGATMRYREAIRRYRELRLELDEAQLAIDMVYVLGPTDPLTVEEVARARTTFAANHARTYLDQLEIALDRGAHATPDSPAGVRAPRKASVPTS